MLPAAMGQPWEATLLKKRVADFEESVLLVCSIVMFNIFSIFHSASPIIVVVSIMQNMVLISGAQLFNGEGAGFVVGNNVIKDRSNIKSIIKLCCSSATVINGDG